jgi:hypothetical protein
VHGSASQSKEHYTVKDSATGKSVGFSSSGLQVHGVEFETQGLDGENFARFTLITYKSIKINGNALATYKPTGTNEVNSSGHVVIRTGTIRAHGTSFTTTDM